MNFTPNQQKAIDDKSGTLLISAGAGSGKTAVLTERIARRIADPECGDDISRFLIVTFTKAATSELRQRLTKKLREIVRNNPSNKHAMRQLSKIGLAKICTIHSFCLDLIRTNFQLLGLSAKLRMADDAETEIMLQSITDSILEEKYNAFSDDTEDGEKDNGFIMTAELFSGAKNDKNFSSTIIGLYKFIRTLPDPFGYLDDSINNYREVSEALGRNEEFFSTGLGDLCRDATALELKAIIVDANTALDISFLDEITQNLYSPVISADLQSFGAVGSALTNTYTGAMDEAYNLEKKRLPTAKNANYGIRDRVQKLRTAYWKKFEKLRSRMLSASAEELKAAADCSYEILVTLKDIITELDKRYTLAKRERNILDYSDLEHMALKLLVNPEDGSPTELARTYAQGLGEIYIDEYQDVNPLQDMIFKAVSTYRDGCECNRFLVGDLKQSIYRFRGAKPEIFSDYIRHFPALDTEEAGTTHAHKLYLSNNFRCSQSVIDFTNIVFSAIMHEYSEDDKLIYSKSENHKITAPCEVALVLDSNNPTAGVEDDSDEQREDIDLEALYVAQRIKKMVGNPLYKNADGNTYSYKDFAVLLRSANAHTKSYRRAFEIVGVPLSTDAPDDFFSRPEVLLTLCLLNTVDNPERDIYTCGLMRSELFCFNDDELTEIRMSSRHTSFWGCVSAFANDNPDSAIGKKVNAFVGKIGEYRAKSRGLPADKLISYLYDDTGIMSIVCGKSSAKRESLQEIYEYARSFERTSFHGLSSFIEYLSDLSKAGSGVRTGNDNNSVTLMSIHRSKGLEFPVCFVTALGKAFNTEDQRKTLVQSDHAGLGLRLKNFPGNKFYPTDTGFTYVDTPFRRAIITEERCALVQEEKRLLYVAMTRARERLILVAGGRASFNIFNKMALSYNTKSREYYIPFADNYITWILAAMPERMQKDMVHNYTCLISTCRHGNCPYFDDVNKKCNVVFDIDETRVAVVYAAFADKLTIDEFYKKAKSPDSTDGHDSSVDISLAKEYLDHIKDITSFKYEGETDGKKRIHIPAKVSVSDLKYGLCDELENQIQPPKIKDMPDFMKQETDVSEADAAERGTAVHVFMQFCNFEECAKGKEEIITEINRLREAKFITPRQAELIDADKISVFFEGSLYRDTLAKSARIFRERRFNLSVPAKNYIPEGVCADTDFILVQGVIDCFCKNPDGSYTLIDFKTDSVKKGQENILVSRHRVQLEFYKRAVEEMTGGVVSKCYLYSFALGKEIEV